MIDAVDRGLIMMQWPDNAEILVKIFSFTGVYAIIVRSLVNMV